MPLENVRLSRAAEDVAGSAEGPGSAAHSIVVPEERLPKGDVRGTTNSYGRIMAMWEQLHGPFLRAADEQPDPLRQIADYGKTIRVDYACELANQKLSDVARRLAPRGGDGFQDKPRF